MCIFIFSAFFAVETKAQDVVVPVNPDLLAVGQAIDLLSTEYRTVSNTLATTPVGSANYTPLRMKACYYKGIMASVASGFALAESLVQAKGDASSLCGAEEKTDAHQQQANVLYVETIVLLTK